MKDRFLEVNITAISWSDFFKKNIVEFNAFSRTVW